MAKRRILKLDTVTIENPDSLNLIIGQSHFIKTVEDMHEALVSSVPGILFGLAFSEASGTRLIRTTGTDNALIKLAAKNTEKLACGHVFVLFLGNAFPINVLHALRRTPEFVTLYCATANPAEVIVARTGQGGAILGVVDGGPPKGVETPKDMAFRMGFLRKLGYKLSDK